MKWILVILFSVSTSAQAMTKEAALERTKKRIESLKSYFADLTYNCFMFSEDCQIMDNSQEVVLKWIGNENSKHEPIFEYSKGSENFFIDGAVRIAKTGSTWGSPVIFNEDLLVRETATGNFEALDLFEILGILVHEYGHHQDEMLRMTGLRILEHQELDQLAVKVVSYLKDRTRKVQISKDEVPALADGEMLELLQIEKENWLGVRHIWSYTFIDSSAGIEEISKTLVAGLSCPVTYSHGHINFMGVPAYASYRKVKSPVTQQLGNTVKLEQEIGEGSVLCIDREMGRYNVFDGYENGKLTLHFDLTPAGQLIYQTGSVTFKVQPK